MACIAMGKLIWCIALKAMGSCQRYIRFVLVLWRIPHPYYTPKKYTKATVSQWMALLQPPHQHVCVREDHSWYFQQHPHVVICMTMESFKLYKRFVSDPGNNIKDVILFHQTYEIHGHGSPWMAYFSSTEHLWQKREGAQSWWIACMAMVSCKRYTRFVLVPQRMPYHCYNCTYSMTYVIGCNGRSYFSLRILYMF